MERKLRGYLFAARHIHSGKVRYEFYDWRCNREDKIMSGVGKPMKT